MKFYKIEIITNHLNIFNSIHISNINIWKHKNKNIVYIGKKLFGLKNCYIYNIKINSETNLILIILTLLKNQNITFSQDDIKIILNKILKIVEDKYNFIKSNSEYFI